MKTILPQGVSAPVLGLNTCICLLFSNISSETAWSIKAKLHVEPPWEGRKKGYINGSGHMTKMAAMPVYALENNRPMIMKLGM